MEGKEEWKVDRRKKQETAIRGKSLEGGRRRKGRRGREVSNKQWWTVKGKGCRWWGCGMW